MIWNGALIHLRICCPWCGKPLSHTIEPDSAFYSIICNEPDCEECGNLILIERATSKVVFIDRRQWKTYDGRRWRLAVEEIKG